jgi:hypothetical protein
MCFAQSRQSEGEITPRMLTVNASVSKRQDANLAEKPSVASRTT